MYMLNCDIIASLTHSYQRRQIEEQMQMLHEQAESPMLDATSQEQCFGIGKFL